MSRNWRWLTEFKIIVMYTSISCLTGIQRVRTGQEPDYWNDITAVVEDELHKLHKQEKQSSYEAGTVLHEFSCGSLVCVCSCVQIFIIILPSLFTYLRTYLLAPWLCGPLRTFAYFMTDAQSSILFSMHLHLFTLSSHKSFCTSSSHPFGPSHLSPPCGIF
jgi:hypothetical protein